MGRLKRKSDWQYQKKPDARKPVSPGVRAAVELASYEWGMRKAAAKILAVDKEVERARLEEVDQITNEFTDWDFGCAALVLHRRYGYDAEECAAFLTDVQSLTKEFQEAGMFHSDIWDTVRDEVGLDVVVENES